jgi:aminoglycoside phosphotransferase
VDIDDPVLPAVAHLMGPGANDILAAAVEAADGALRHVRVSQVQYRPGHDLVVQYRCDIDWREGRRRNDTLLAGTTLNGPLPGTLPLVAETAAGQLEVSVWRYPFDPVVEGLPIAVTAERLAPLFASTLRAPLTLKVVAYRPTERAVVRVLDGAGRTTYVKAVRPAAVQALVDRHQQLRTAGLPVPEVIDADIASGLVVLAELPGPTLRERIKADLAGRPTPEALLRLTGQLARIPAAGLPKVAGRIRDAMSHARVLESVAPDVAQQLRELVVIFARSLPEVDARSGGVIHGDLHEGQLIVNDGGEVVGLLDIDDLGLGDPLDDLATLAAHTRFRALAAGAAGDGIRRYSDQLRAGFAQHVDSAELDIAISAVLVGLATGPFRIQQSGWPATVSLVIDDALSLAEAAVRHGS